MGTSVTEGARARPGEARGGLARDAARAAAHCSAGPAPQLARKPPKTYRKFTEKRRSKTRSPPKLAPSQNDATLAKPVTKNYTHYQNFCSTKKNHNFGIKNLEKLTNTFFFNKETNTKKTFFFSFRKVQVFQLPILHIRNVKLWNEKKVNFCFCFSLINAFL